jgi:hypothetical protein
LTPVGAHSAAPGFKRRILLMRRDFPTWSANTWIFLLYIYIIIYI